MTVVCSPTLFTVMYAVRFSNRENPFCIIPQLERGGRNHTMSV